MIPTLFYADSFPVVTGIREQILAHSTFKPYQSPHDGVIYPGIAENIPANVKRIFQAEIETCLHLAIDTVVIFSRIMSAGMAVPHRVHSDRIMAEFSAHLYLSTEFTEGSGTGFFRHKIFGDRHTAETIDSEVRPNSPEDWQEYARIPARFGRLLIHDATLWHCAFPLEGFGQAPEDSRMVLTAFFNIAKL